MVTRKNIKILHLASFNGNIGDMLSHRGLDLILKQKQYGASFVTDRLDIRRFYQNAQNYKLSFDSACAEYFNYYDLVIIGGGGYLKQSFPKAVFGNTFDFNDDFLRRIKTKILFYSIGGLSAANEVDDLAYEKTERLMDILANHKHMYLLFRSDGTMRNSRFLNSITPDSTRLMEIFDSAYLNERSQIQVESDHVVINIGEDQARKNQSYYSEILQSTAEKIIALNKINENWVFKFVPHTYFDVRAFVNLCEYLPEHLKRNNLKCCETYSLASDIQKVIDVYRNAELALTGRFHATAFALLYSKSFAPLYKFDRSIAQLGKIGIDIVSSQNSSSLNESTAGLGIDFDNSEIDSRLKLNREITSSFVDQVLVR